MSRAGSKAYRRAAGLVVASAVVVLSAACGGGSDASGNEGGNGDGARNSAFAAYTDCLKQNGVKITMSSGGPQMRPSGMPPPSGMPRPSGSAGFRNGGGFPGGDFRGGGKPEGVDDATWQKAQAACSSLRPSGRPGGGNGNRGDGRNAAYENCLKENGVTDLSKMNSDDAAVKKAVETCQVLRPSASATPTA